MTSYFARRSAARSRPGRRGAVGFEVDRIDDTFSVGWSVLATGRIRRARNEAERTALAGLEVEPWSGSGRDTYLVLEVTEITGRRIEAES